MKKLFIFLCILLAAVNIVQFRFNRQLNQRISYLESIQPYLSPGEKISYFDLIGVENEDFNAKILNETGDRPYLIYIFQEPCTPCNRNLILWGKMARILQKNVNIIGIILDSQQNAFEFSQKAGLNFKLFVPQDIDLFKDKMKIRLNVAQTILYHSRKIEYISIGNLSGETYAKFLSAAKNISACNLK